MLSVAEDHSCLLNYSVLLVPSAEPHAVPRTVQLLQVLMEMEMGVMQLPLFHGWKPWAVVLWCSGQWTLQWAVLNCLRWWAGATAGKAAVLVDLVLIGLQCGVVDPGAWSWKMHV
ncbi:hypothetical protein Nepgr_022846 [Nepenthes gracilis]|uniref:Uncharacterized protein n=1 Tax=Nepenthes gracilis TaxID=150966 RepID=A0AAD3T1R3_NEPGR|nr:hypothetical protein Nepgr_022846 [Nepenthes gracilis]